MNVGKGLKNTLTKVWSKMIDLNSTHDVNLKSWVDSANEDSTDFPIQNLPLGVFRENEKEQFRCGVGIGNFILDISID